MRYLRLGIAGMRGEVGTGLNPALAIDFASAMGTYLDGGKIIVASDTRISSPMIHNAVISALLSCGCEILDAGIAPAPVVHFLVPHLKADGALLLGAGHHPAGWNAIVPFDRKGAYFNSVQLQELLDIYHGRRYKTCVWNKMGCLKDISNDFTTPYLEKIFSFIDTKAIAKRKLRIIADFCNGAGSVLADKFAEWLGIELIPINNAFSGILPHDPEPRPRSSMQVQSIMKPLKADAGFVFNSDMSRAAIVTDTGETLSEEYTLPLVADHVLSTCPPGSPAVTNWCTTKTFDDIVKRHKGVVHKTRVGQSFIIDKMIEIEAVISGDGSGSAAFNDSINGFDSYMIMAKILEAMTHRDLSLSKLSAELPRYHIIKRKINCPSAHAYTLLRSAGTVFGDAVVSEEDGLRFDWKDGWIHLRASATEPVIRMIVEWRTSEQAEDMALQMQGQLERLLVTS